MEQDSVIQFYNDNLNKLSFEGLKIDDTVTTIIIPEESQIIQNIYPCLKETR